MKREVDRHARRLVRATGSLARTAQRTRLTESEASVAIEAFALAVTDFGRAIQTATGFEVDLKEVVDQSFDVHTKRGQSEREAGPRDSAVVLRVE